MTKKDDAILQDPNTGMEELVEEIGELLADYYTGDTEDGLWFCFPFHEDREFIAEAITRIGKATIEGELDEALGVAGRAVWAKPGDEDHIYDWVADVIESGTRTFIALGQEEGE